MWVCDFFFQQIFHIALIWVYINQFSSAQPLSVTMQYISFEKATHLKGNTETNKNYIFTHVNCYATTPPTPSQPHLTTITIVVLIVIFPLTIVIIHGYVGIGVELGTVVRVRNILGLERATCCGIIVRFRQRWFLKLDVTLGSKVGSRDNPVMQPQWRLFKNMVKMTYIIQVFDKI